MDRYDTICLEDLSIADMTKNHSLARAISDMGWRELRSMLEYKAEWAGKNISVIGRFDPSSKMCSCCGKVNRELKLSDRKWICSCGANHDRDVNAAINIKQFGLRNQPGDLNVKQRLVRDTWKPANSFVGSSHCVMGKPMMHGDPAEREVEVLPDTRPLVRPKRRRVHPDPDTTPVPRPKNAQHR